MTTYNKQTLATFFQTGDVPTGTDYANLIDSCVNQVETSAQSIAGPLVPTELITPRVSATNANVTVLLSAAALNVQGTVSANSVNTGTLIIGTTLSVGTNLTVTGNTAIGGNLTVSADVSATNGSVYASAMRVGTALFHPVPVIISAAGTAQATGASLTAEICRLQGATDGQTTGFSLMANRTSWVQYLANECTVSANLWPPTGGQINNLGANTVFPMAAGTPYIVIHRAASAYSVK